VVVSAVIAVILRRKLYMLGFGELNDEVDDIRTQTFVKIAVAQCPTMRRVGGRAAAELKQGSGSESGMESPPPWCVAR